MITFSADQRFIVTGASSGIGESVALMLNSLGATVIAIGRNLERLEQAKTKAVSSDGFLIEVKDLTENLAELPSYIKELKNKYGKFRGLVCAAGITEIKPLQLVEVEGMKQLFDINYFVPVLLTQGFVDRRNNVGRGSSIVCISSIAAHTSERGKLTYSGAKAALVASMKSISKELAPAGIRVNCVSPGIIATPMILNNEFIKDSIIHRCPLGYGMPEDIANLIVYLLSDKGKWITGSNYTIDGGFC